MRRADDSTEYTIGKLTGASLLPIWSLFEELTSAQMNALDIYPEKALDAVGGGTHATANPLSVTGEKWTMHQPFEFGSDTDAPHTGPKET